LALTAPYALFDATCRFPVSLPPIKAKTECICGQVLTGLAAPRECRLFGLACTPENPVGPCMVSSEGACAAHYQYGAS